MKRNITISLIALISLIFMTCSATQKMNVSGEKQAVDYVNPYMGNISHLLVPTFPTIHLPNSMLRVYPERLILILSTWMISKFRLITAYHINQRLMNCNSNRVQKLI